MSVSRILFLVGAGLFAAGVATELPAAPARPPQNRPCVVHYAFISEHGRAYVEMDTASQCQMDYRARLHK